MANPLLAPGALEKPSKLDRDVAKHQKRVTKRAERRVSAKQDVAKWRAIGDAIFKRDQGKCRACLGRVHRSDTGNPARRAETHHIVYRSAGGTDETSNLVLLCASCHQLEHEHRITITGNGDGVLHIRGSSGSLAVWHKPPCPTAQPRAEEGR